MARVFDKQRQTVTNTETGAVCYYGVKSPGREHSIAFYEDVRALGTLCEVCRKSAADHSDAEIDACNERMRTKH